MRIYLVFAFIIVLMAFTENNPLVGKWESKPSAEGTVTGVVFKANNEFDTYINSTPYISGTYTVKGNVFSISDYGCPGNTGTYKLIFFANSDSLRFEAIEDGCERRKFSIEATVLGRVK